MSIEKLSDDSRTNNEQIPYTQISNQVIHGIKNGDAFLVWSYLQSKTGNWKVIKQNIKNMYGFGDVKLKQIFSYLNRCGLIRYVQPKCAKGTFAPVRIDVLSGANFDKTQAYIEDAPVGQKTAPAVNRTNGNNELLNKDITKERKEHNNNISSATEVAHTPSEDSFDEFWKIYPIKKNKIRAKKIWERKKCSTIVTLICKDILNRLANEAQWQDIEFIPHASTYLNNERWNDDVIYRRPKQASQGNGSFSNVMYGKSDAGVTYDERGNSINPFN